MSQSLGASSPFFSVVIPTFNRRAAVIRAIDSVLSQDFSDFELIVVDDGSSDDTEQHLRCMRDERLQVIRQDNSGGSIARNRGIDHASGKFIAFLDSDDEFKPGKLRRFAEVIASDDAEVLYSSAMVNRGRGVASVKPTRGLRPGEAVDEYLFCDAETISTITLVVCASLAKVVRFRPNLVKGQDLDFVVRLYRNGARFKYIDEPLSIWNDTTSVGRVSHGDGGAALEEWLAKCSSLLSRKAYYGFRANFLSGELAARAPLKAIWFLVTGFVLGNVSLKRTAHSTARAFIPRNAYRSFVDLVLRVRRQHVG